MKRYAKARQAAAKAKPKLGRPPKAKRVMVKRRSAEADKIRLVVGGLTEEGAKVLLLKILLNEGEL